MTSQEYRESCEALRTELNEALNAKDENAKERIKNELFELWCHFWDEEGPPDIHSQC